MIRRLLVLNGLAVLAAVLNHAVHWSITAMFWWTYRYRPVRVPDLSQSGCVAYWVLRCLDLIAIAAVPAFLFISGFFATLVGRGNQTKNVWKAVLNRVNNLLPPYLFWSFVMVCLNLLKGKEYTLWGLLVTIIRGSVAEPFYYVPVLIQCYLLAPILVPLVRNRLKPLLSIIGFSQTMISVSILLFFVKFTIPGMAGFFAFLRNWKLVELILWFVLGIVASTYLSEFNALLLRFKRLTITLCVISFIFAMVEWSIFFQLSAKEWIAPPAVLFQKLFTLFLIASYFAHSGIPIACRHQLGQIGERSYGIYLAHVPVLELVSKAIYHATPRLLAYQSLFLPTIVFFGIAIPLFIMTIIKRSPARKLYPLMFG